MVYMGLKTSNKGTFYIDLNNKKNKTASKTVLFFDLNQVLKIEN